MWILAEYEASSLFSLKPATATSSGGKTLLVPTPFAIKMALLDVICRTEGQAVGEAAWLTLCTTTIALHPAPRVVVNNTFTKILKPRRHPASPDTAHAGPLQKTIGYREYAYLDGPFGLGLEVDDQIDLIYWQRWLAGIQSLGKRGSFVQLLKPPQSSVELPDGHLKLDGTLPSEIAFDSVLQQLDDTSEAVSFERVNIYSDEKIRLGTDRLLRQALLPYRMQSSSRSYTFYEMVRQ